MANHEAPEQEETPAPGPVDPVDTSVPAPPDAGKRPEPVLDAARVAGVITGVILGVGGLLKLVGHLVPVDYDLKGLATQASTAIFAIAAAWGLVGPWITARIRARDKVTPLESPRDALGRKLTLEGT